MSKMSVTMLKKRMSCKVVVSHIFSLPGMIGWKADSQFDGASHILADGFFRLNHQLGWITVLSWPWVWTWCIRNWRSLFGRPVDFARWEVRLSAVGLGLGGVRLGPEKVSAWVGWNLGWQRWFCLGFLIRLGLRLVGRLVVWIMNSFRILGSAWINQSGRSLDLIQTCFATKIKSRMLTKYTNEIHRPKYSRNV